MIKYCFCYLEEETEDTTSTPSISSTSTHGPPPIIKNHSYIIVGDNLDKNIHPRFMTKCKQGESLHFFHAYAALDRIDFTHLNNDEPIGQTDKLSLSTCLPDISDCNQLRQNYAVLLGREIVRTIKYFKKCERFIPSHIVHMYSEQMRHKSTIVSACLVLS